MRAFLNDALLQIGIAASILGFVTLGVTAGCVLVLITPWR